AVWTGTYMMVYGGHDNSYNPVGGGGRYDPATNTWLAVNSGAGSPGIRKQHTMNYEPTTGLVVLWGGYTGSAMSKAGHMYDPSANTWTAMKTSGAPSARDDQVSVAADGKMIIFGGYDGTIL